MLNQLLKKRVIKATVQINGKDTTFIGTEDNKLSSSGLRVEANITYGAGNITPTAQINIYGLLIETMTPLMRISWNTLGAVLNTVRIEVGEQGDTALTLAYEGNITFAKIVTANAPTMCLQIESQMAIVESLTPQNPKTYNKGIDTADIIRDICTEMGYQFENNEATHILSNELMLEGSRLSRIQYLAHICDFELYVDQRAIAICKKGNGRTIKIPIISPKTGLLGYPEPDIRGVTFRCLYSPLIKFGGIVKIADSLIPTCNGDWRVYGLHAILEANAPNARWEMQVMATPRGSNYVAIR